MNFGDKVRVISGVYRGMTGRVLYQTGARWDYYAVRLDGGPNRDPSIKASFLEPEEES